MITPSNGCLLPVGANVSCMLHNRRHIIAHEHQQLADIRNIHASKTGI